MKVISSQDIPETALQSVMPICRVPRDKLTELNKMGVEAENVIRWVDAWIHARVYPKFDLQQGAKLAEHQKYYNANVVYTGINWAKHDARQT
jgi:hypothetical protein